MWKVAHGRRTVEYGVSGTAETDTRCRRRRDRAGLYGTSGATLHPIVLVVVDFVVFRISVKNAIVCLEIPLYCRRLDGFGVEVKEGDGCGLGAPTVVTV
jgi:hypothetical protein